MTGARPLAVTDCLNFGSPEDPDSMWQLVEAIRGLADACRTLGVPVTGGNVSLYNGTGEPGQIDSSIHPTPVVGVLGVLDDVARAIGSGWTTPGQSVYLLGTTRAELDGSAWADVVHGHLGGTAAGAWTSPRSARSREVMAIAARDVLVDAAHDLSEGGLAQALVESSLRYGTGVRVSLDALCARDEVTPFEALFSESTARAVVAVPRAAGGPRSPTVPRRGVPFLAIGTTTDAAGDRCAGRGRRRRAVHAPARRGARRRTRRPCRASSAEQGGPTDRGDRGQAGLRSRATLAAARRASRTGWAAASPTDCAT